MQVFGYEVQVKEGESLREAMVRNEGLMAYLRQSVGDCREEEARAMGFSSAEMQSVVMEEETRKYIGVKRKGGETTGKAKELRGRYREEKWLDV